MAEYTYKDVIIDPDDPRVEIGKEYWCGATAWGVLDSANNGHRSFPLLDVRRSDNKPFILSSVNSDAFTEPCIIRKKEPKKKYVPFDFDDFTVRRDLMGKTIKANNRLFSRQYVELTITCFELVDKGAEGVSGYWMANGIKEDELFHDWTFLDGAPCGKEVEE